jgi:hypothetical protein
MIFAAVHVNGLTGGHPPGAGRVAEHDTVVDIVAMHHVWALNLREMVHGI